MGNPLDQKDLGGLVKREQHSVVAAARRAQPLELATEGLAHPLGICGECGGDELDYSRRDAWGEPIEASDRAGGKPDVPVHESGKPYRARRSFTPTV